MVCISWQDGKLGKMITGMDGTGPVFHPLPTCNEMHKASACILKEFTVETKIYY